MLKKLSQIKNLSCEEARKIVNFYSDKMIDSNDSEKNNIKHLFVEMLNKEENYEYFSFGEIVLFFLFESKEFTEKEKVFIMKYICNNIQQFCNSRNDMVPTILLDFIIRNISKKIRSEYCNSVILNSLDNPIKKCLSIILNKSNDI